ncbi:flavodoxin family protein [Planctomycetales bacterium]|nr:flavodoxin family protein [Planctomycetales bacterium]GHT36500.1 flavodoxin family protein [Planctomycetales bacterium]
MKLLAVNGSPRKNWNTARLLNKIAEGASSQGAETELIHLCDLKFSGCISCFRCKEIGGKWYGRCAVKDELTPILQKAREADVLVLGTPFYFCAETAAMRAFEERLWFQYYLYSAIKEPLSPKKKATALVYTMNVKQEDMDDFGKTTIIKRAKMVMERLFAPCEVFLSCDTKQFDDYSKYDTDIWDVPAKLKRHDEVFPQELEQAFTLGIKLASS